MGDAPQTPEAPAMGAPTNHLDPIQPPKPADATSGDEMGETGKKALETERKARRDAEARLKELEPLAEEARNKADAEKSELTKTQEALASERDARTKAEAELLR